MSQNLTNDSIDQMPKVFRPNRFNVKVLLQLTIDRFN